MEASARLFISPSPYRGIILSKSLAELWPLVRLQPLLNKFMKFHKICFDTFKVIAKVKICHNDDDNDYPDDDNITRVMAIPRLFFLKTSELKFTIDIHLSLLYSKTKCLRDRTYIEPAEFCLWEDGLDLDKAVELSGELCLGFPHHFISSQGAG